MSIFSELKRRNVFKVAAVYVVVAWILLQVSDTLAPALHLPEWFHSGVAFLLILGFPIAVVLAWAYEMTPEGLKKDRNVDHSHPVARKTKDTFFYTIIGILVIVLGAVTFWPPGDLETTVPQPAGEQFESGAPTIAVLSFANASNDPDQDYFSSGLTAPERVEQDPIIATTINRPSIAGWTVPFFSGGGGGGVGVVFVGEGRNAYAWLAA